MKTHIALLRGINVAGQKKVPMAELRALLETKKLKKVKTYIQSGNVIFQSSITENETLEAIISEAIKKKFGFEVPVLVVDSLVLEGILEDCPFGEDKKEKSYFTLLKTVPEQQFIKKLMALEFNDEEVAVTNNCVYFYSNKGYGKSKCNNNFIEKHLKVSATTRNYKTMLRLLTIASDISYK